METDRRGTAGRGAMLRRLLPGLLMLCAIAAFAALWAGGAHGAYFALLNAVGVSASPMPFLDTHGVLAAIDCHRRGIDVYLTNPCDVLGRVHVYTPLWFRLGALPIDMGMTPALGLVLAGAFAASLALLPPGRDRLATAVICAAALSPATGFAVERGNADVLLFILAALVGCVAWRRLPTRLLGFPIIVLAAMLKVYPATLLLLALRERRGLALAIGGLSAAALLAYAAADAAGLRAMLAVVPRATPFIYSFGLRNLPDGLGGMLGWSAATVTLVQVAMLVAAVLAAAGQAGRLRAAAEALTPAETSGALIGACLIVGCCVAGQSGEYRAIHLLFVFPGLTALAGAPGPARSLARRMTWIMLLQLWGDVISAPLAWLAQSGLAQSGLAQSGLAQSGLAQSGLAQSGLAQSGLAQSGAAQATAAGRTFLLIWLVREVAWWWAVAMLMALLAGLLPAGRRDCKPGFLMPGLSPPLRPGGAGSAGRRA